MTFVRKIFVSGAFLCALSSITTAAMAADYKAQDLTVREAWARASAGMARAGAAFMVIENHGAGDDAIVSAEANVSKVVELHTHIHENGMMRMRQIPQIDLPAGQRVDLKPGGLHVMFIGLNQPLTEGQTFDVKLNFKKSGSITLPVTVQGVGAKKYMPHK